MKSIKLWIVLTMVILIIGGIVYYQNGLSKKPAVIKIEKPAANPCADGKKLFQANCSSCHALNSKLVGPPFAVAAKIRKREWLIKYIRNNVKMADDGDSLAIAIKDSYDGGVMTTFPYLTDVQIGSMIDYAKDCGAGER